MHRQEVSHNIKSTLPKKITTWFMLFFCGFFSLALLANKNNPGETEDKRLQQYKKKSGGTIVSPIVFYQPETRLAFGAAGTFVFRNGESKNNGEQVRPSSISPLIIYTQNKQFRGIVSADIYFKKDDFHLTAEIKYEEYPDKFFGIGSYTPDSYAERYTPHTFDFSLTLSRKLRESIHVGIRYNLSGYQLVEVEPGKLLAQGDIPGSSGSFLSGIGIEIDVDSRDNIFFPRRGNFFKFVSSFYNELLGSEFNYQNYRLDLRKYFPFFTSHVLAVQAVVQTQTGTVPFQQMSKLGGQYLMRGYYEGRFRDRNLVVVQAEYRMPLFWRIGVVGFAGIADVAHRFRDFKFEKVKYAYGLGVRYLFNKSEKMYIRFDAGFSNGSPAFYFSIFEAF